MIEQAAYLLDRVENDEPPSGTAAARLNGKLEAPG